MTGLPSSSIRRLAAVGAAVLCTGCLPHVMHGPRIEDDGVSGSLSLTVGQNREVGGLENEILPSVYGGLRTSRVPAGGDGTAASLGVQVPVLIAPLFANEDTGALDALAATSYVDVYVQPMRRQQPGFEWGVGALASNALAGGYVQVGRMQPDGGGWYTTQLVVFAVGDDFGDEGAYYLPTVVWRYRDPTRTTAANLSAGVGVGVHDGSRTDMLVTLGVTLELGLGK
jgi:hypothetical protein